MKKIILCILSLAIMTLVAAISASSLALVLYAFYGVSCKMSVFFVSIFAVPFYVINFKTGDKLEAAIKEYSNRYITFAVGLLNLPYEDQESMLESYLKGKPKFDVDFYKRATYKLTKKPLIYVKPDGRVTFTLLEVFGTKRPVPYLTL